MTMRQSWQLVEPNWRRVFLHESGHALMAVLQGINCYGIVYLSEEDSAVTLIEPLQAQKTASDLLFLGAGSAAEATQFSGMSFSGAKDDKKLHGGTSPQFNQSVETAYKMLIEQLDKLRNVASKIQSNFELAGSEFNRLPQYDVRINDVVRKVGMLLSEPELKEAAK